MRVQLVAIFSPIQNILCLGYESHRCVECKLKLNSRDINRHLMQIHLSDKDHAYKCPKCDYGSKWAIADVIRHIDNIHDGVGHPIDMEVEFDEKIKRLKPIFILSETVVKAKVKKGKRKFSGMYIHTYCIVCIQSVGKM